MGQLTVRLGDDLHQAAREAARAQGVNLTDYIREAIAEKTGRADALQELTELKHRIERLEQAVFDPK